MDKTLLKSSLDAPLALQSKHCALAKVVAVVRGKGVWQFPLIQSRLLRCVGEGIVLVLVHRHVPEVALQRYDRVLVVAQEVHVRIGWLLLLLLLLHVDGLLGRDLVLQVGYLLFVLAGRLDGVDASTTSRRIHIGHL